MNFWFTLGYVVLGTLLIGLELWGVFRKKRGDTITENWHWVEKALPPVARWFWRVLTLGLLGWIMFHFGGHF